MTNINSTCLGALTTEQRAFLETVYMGFDRRGGEWPIWQYIDLILGARGIDAEAVLASIPKVGSLGANRYGLVWSSQNMSGGSMLPSSTIGLTIGGLHRVAQAGPLANACVIVLGLLLEAEKALVPDPARVLEIQVESKQIQEHLLTASTDLQKDSAPPIEAVMAKVRAMLGTEPYRAWDVNPGANSASWIVRVTRLGTVRAMQGIATAEEYVSFMEDWLTPRVIQVIPQVAAPMELPNALDHLDVVWKIKTGNRLFAGLHAGTCARLTLSCDSEDRFTYLTSAFTEVLSCVVPPLRTVPGDKPLQTLRERLSEIVPAENISRIDDLLERLRKLTLIRNAQQHSGARDKALKAAAELGVQLPVQDWGVTWGQMATIARDTLDALRAEMQTLPDH